MKNDRSPIQRIMDHEKFSELAETIGHVATVIAQSKVEQTRSEANRSTLTDVLDKAVQGLCDANAYLHEVATGNPATATPRVLVTSPDTPTPEDDDAPQGPDAETEAILDRADHTVRRLLGIVLDCAWRQGMDIDAMTVEGILKRLEEMPGMGDEPSRHVLPDGTFTNCTHEALMAWYAAAPQDARSRASAATDAKGREAAEAALGAGTTMGAGEPVTWSQAAAEASAQAGRETPRD